MATLDEARQALHDAFGYDAFRSGQEEIISHLLEDKHALVLMPTGSGKSLCYQIPALVLDELTVVISPLIALMKDQVDALKAREIDAEFINSSLKPRERERRYRAVGEGRYRMLYVTPERFRKTEFLEIMSRRGVSLLAVDEAHCISEWGHDFRPDYTRVDEIRAHLGNPTTVALTATATPDVQKSIIEQLGMTPDEIHTFAHGIERPNLHLEVEHVWGVDEKLEAITRIRSDNPGSGIVYFALIKTLEQYSDALRARGVDHCRYHGKLDPGPRKRIQDSFMGGDEPMVLATNAFGMGVDKEDIRYVVHAEAPGSMESYYQEIGRSGRDGKPSTCCLLYDQRDLEIQMQFVKWSNPSAEYYNRIYHLIAEQNDAVNGFGLEWVRLQLHHKNRGDRRPETALKMLERWGATEGGIEDQNLVVVGDLPEPLTDQDRLGEKLLRDRKKLYALVQYANLEGDRKAFLEDYFGVSGG